MPNLPPNMPVLVIALLLAHAEGANEIGIDHLLAALDAPASREPKPPIGGPFVPAPCCELPLSEGARSVMCSVGDAGSASVDSLRSALLRAKQRGAR